MKKVMCIIGIITAAAILSGCGTQINTNNADNPGASAVRPKAAQTERQTTAELQTDTELLPGADSSAEQITEASPAQAATAAQGESGAVSAEGLITEDEAKAIALQDAGVKEEDLSGARVKLEWDDGAYEYEVDFYVGNLEYDYDIDAATGKIISMDRDIEDDFQMTDQVSGEVISEGEAKKIALAKVPEAAEEDVRLHLDWDDGRQIYEGSIYLNGVEYEFEIDAATGTVLEWEEDD